MDLQRLRYFVAAAEAGTISRAARRCGVAQPSLSQQVRKLESELGVTLFDRLGRGVALTDAGRALLPRARRILAELNDVEAGISRQLRDGRLSLAIGAIPTIAPFLLPPALEALRADFPHSDVSIREDLTERLVEALADNQIDCAIVSTPLNHDLIELEVIGREDLVVVAPPPPATAPPRRTISPADLGAGPIVSLEDFHCLGRQIQGFCNSRRITPQTVCRSTQLSTILEMVALGVGLSIVPEMAAARDTPGRRSYLRLAGERPGREIAVAWRKDRSRPRLALRFIEHVARNIASGLHRLPAEAGAAGSTRRQRRTTHAVTATGSPLPAPGLPGTASATSSSGPGTQRPARKR